VWLFILLSRLGFNVFGRQGPFIRLRLRAHVFDFQPFMLAWAIFRSLPGLQIVPERACFGGVGLRRLFIGMWWPFSRTKV